MWLTTDFPLENPSIPRNSEIYLGWKELLFYHNGQLIDLDDGRIIHEGPVEDCSLSRDYCAILSNGRCHVVGLYDNFRHEIDINDVKQVSAMPTGRLAIRTSNDVVLYNFLTKTTMANWKLKCTSIAAGFEHIIAISDGKVYSYGDGSRGQQGSGDLIASDELSPIVDLEEVNIVNIAAGGWHSAAVSDRGYLYQWGWNNHGQVIQSATSENLNVIASPMLNQSIDSVIEVACGSRHTVVLKENRTVLSWGWNQYGQCDTSKFNFDRVQRINAAFWTSAAKIQ